MQQEQTALKKRLRWRHRTTRARRDKQVQQPAQESPQEVRKGQGWSMAARSKARLSMHTALTREGGQLKV